MTELVATEALSEAQFAELVDALAADPRLQPKLKELLSEAHPHYNQRGAATIVRMRGWVLLSLARAGVSDDTLLYLLEELDTGVDPYLVAVAAYALRSYPEPNSAFAPYVMRAINQIRYHNDPVSFESYGDDAISSDATTPVRELLLTLAWLGPKARVVSSELEALSGLPKRLQPEVERARQAIIGTEQLDSDDCCSLPASLKSRFSWALGSRRGSESIETTMFEDHDGATVTFKEFFQAQPSIVVFFYTRCDNPLKCSLTITKLARIQKLLDERGLVDQIRTAAITYDPAFDLAHRIRGYGQNRAVLMNACHRMLRVMDGFDALREHFKLGVNFIESLVNRHRLEVYILDGKGRIAASFERLHWNEQEVVDRASEVLAEGKAPEVVTNSEGVDIPASQRRSLSRNSSPVWGTLASLAVAFFPKCPICWAAYLSVLGIAGLNQIPYSPWLQPLLAVVMLVNIISVWLRGWSTGRLSGPYLVTAGAFLIVASRIGAGWEKVALGGVVLTLAGSLLNAFGRGFLAERRQPVARSLKTRINERSV